MAAKVQTHLVIPQGQYFEQEWEWGSQEAGSEPFVPYNLAGYTAYCQIRASQSRTSKLLATPNVSLDAPNGRVVLSVSDAVSALWTWKSGWYDLILVPADGKDIRFAEGRVTVDPGVTVVS